MSKGNVFVGMSGGVDSSVAALSLCAQDYAVQGVFMKNWEEDDDAEHCTASADLSDAKAVCNKLAIGLHTVNFSQQYWDRVFAHFLESLRRGFTPNPDILCNQEIKFRAFLDHCLELGADFIATGHYVQKAYVDGAWHLCRGADPQKDQSYFLYTLTQRALEKSLFPVGGIPKGIVRQKAETAGFITHNKKDSTGICFIGERRFQDFLSTYLPAQPGDICTLSGDVIGRHNGLMYFTLGQRQGLKIGGRRDAGTAPWYVADKDLKRNVLTVVQGSDHPALFSKGLQLDSLHWIGPPPEPNTPITAKVRYRQQDVPCTLSYETKTAALVSFETPVRAVTPGQAIVFYQGERCLGGGTITERIPVC